MGILHLATWGYGSTGWYSCALRTGILHFAARGCDPCDDHPFAWCAEVLRLASRGCVFARGRLRFCETRRQSSWMGPDHTMRGPGFCPEVRYHTTTQPSCPPEPNHRHSILHLRRQSNLLPTILPSILRHSILPILRSICPPRHHRSILCRALALRFV